MVLLCHFVRSLCRQHNLTPGLWDQVVAMMQHTHTHFGKHMLHHIIKKIEEIRREIERERERASKKLIEKSSVGGGAWPA